MNSSYNYRNLDASSFNSDGSTEEYDYYATENMQTYDFDKTGSIDSSIEALLLSGASISSIIE